MPPSTQGVWTGALRTPGDSQVLGDDGGVYPVHLILLHTGRVLMFSGGWEGQDLLHRSFTFDPATWDPANRTAGVTGRWFLPEFDDDPIANPPPPTGAHDPDIDLFCAHHVQIADGRILVVGGDGVSSHNNDSIHFYDPVVERWSRIPDEMLAGRWYPTATLLPDGSVLTFSGDGGGLVEEVEIMSPPDYVPREVQGGVRQIGGSDVALFMYPGMILVPGGRIFYVPISFRYSAVSQTALEDTLLGNTSSFRMMNLHSTPPSGTWEDHGVRPSDMLREEGTAVLLSPAQAGRIALIGGGWYTGGTQLGAGNSVEILDTQAPSPAWTTAGQMHHARINVNAVLLPDGKVLIFGGHTNYKWTANAERRFTAEIFDPTVPFDPMNPSAAFVETEMMARSRMYHSAGILLPDGRVLVAGGDDNFVDPAHADEVVGGSSQRSMEFYEPPYMHNGPRPVIDAVHDTGGAADQIHYGGEFTIDTTATTIDMVALMRPGAMTHHTDTEQRHIPLVFWSVPGGLRARVVSDASVAPPGYYMLWIVDDQGRPCERAPFLRLSAERCSLITNRSHFSLQEVEAEGFGGVMPVFEESFFVVMHGYRPEQLGITTTTPSIAQLAAWSPTISFHDTDTGTPMPQIVAEATAMHLEVSALDVRQRVTFEYSVTFTSTAIFPAEGAADDRRDVTLTVQAGTHTCDGAIVLFRQANPYMSDGPTHWLSKDVRVFQIQPGDSQSGITFGMGQSPIDYLSGFLSTCDGTADSASHPFRQISEDQQASQLELATTKDGDPVYNFAVARVRYQSLAAPAADTRVFFRLFTTAVTNMSYQAETYPRDNATLLPTLGASASEILTIPFFSVPRSGVGATGDTENVKTLPSHPAGDVTLRYFGVYLDINQPDLAYTDPGDGVMKSVRDLIRGKHQCLVAEIHFGADPIPPAATPANNENLSQRNLAIVESDNPGPQDAHTITHTFDLQTTWTVRQVEHTALLVHNERFNVPGHPAGDFDELIITWGALPADSVATIFMPDVRADDIVRVAAERHETQLLEKVDEHTIRCRIADVTYVPLPVPARQRIAGLLTIQLPLDVEIGEEFQVVVRQHATHVGQIVGQFQVTIPVSTSEKLLAPELRWLGVMRSIGETITPSSRWFAIFERYLKVTEDRVRGFGGDPDRPQRPDAGADGPGRRRPPIGKGCGLLGLCWALLLAAAAFFLGLIAGVRLLQRCCRALIASKE